MSYLVRQACQKLLSYQAIGATKTGPVLAAKMLTPKRGISSVEDFLELKVDTKDSETYVEAIPVNTGRENKLIHIDSGACALCRLNITNLDYTDVKILSQFIKRDGSLATYHESKLCGRQYTKVKQLIKRAQRCNLIPRPADYLVPGPWHELNTYLEADRKRDQPMKVIKKQYWKI